MPYIFKYFVNQSPLPVLQFLFGVGFLARDLIRTASLLPELLTEYQLLGRAPCEAGRYLQHLHCFTLFPDNEGDSHLVFMLGVLGALQPGEPACIVEWSCIVVAPHTNICWGLLDQFGTA